MTVRLPGRCTLSACRQFGAHVGAALLTTVLLGQSPQAKLPESPGLSAVPPVSLSDVQHLLAAGRFEQAETILHASLQRDPSSAVAAYLLAYSLLREGKATEALAAYTRAASLREPSGEDLRNVAQAYILLHDYPDAEKWLTTSLGLEPNSADSWYNLGRLHYLQNRFAESVECFEKTLALAPRNVKGENNLGLAYEGLNRVHDAELAYRQALAWQDAGPPSAASEQPLVNLATLLLHGSDPTEAQGLLLRAESIAPQDPRVHEQLGQLYLHESKFQQAANELRTASDADPRSSSLHFLLGQAYKHLGRQQEASVQFAEAARLAQAPQN